MKATRSNSNKSQKKSRYGGTRKDVHRIIDRSIGRILSLIIFASFTLLLSAASIANPLTDSLTTNSEQPEAGQAAAKKITTAYRIKDGKIKIDGILNEPDWKNARETTNFVQLEPDEGKPATEKTTVKVLYDNQAIYVGVRAYDSQPGKIAKMLSRRDSYCPSDWIRIAFDSYHDQRTAFEFSVNPSGVKRDCLWFNDTDNDENWNAVWDVKTRIDSLGWTAEFKIPFSQLRFANGNGDDVWGFQVERSISRKNENSFWNPMHKNLNQVVSMFGEIGGFHDLRRTTHLEFLPYSVGSVDTYADPDDDPFKTKANYTSRFGADIKYGLTSNITLDLTINPDFGQVEQDPSEVNLTAYESYFDEKRPFFMEGANIFQYSIMLGDDNNEELFYSRRIGRAPQFNPLDTSRWPDAGDYYESTPKFTKILGAAKVTGRTSKGWSIGILEALTDREEAQVELPSGERVGVTVEPMTNYFVARTIKDFNKGRSTIGGILTSVLRDIPNNDLDWLNKSAFTGGIDFTHRWHNDEFQIMGKIIGSHIDGSREAMLEAQTSSARYYQRPDAKHLGVDSSLTYMNGFAMTLFGGKFAGGNWRYGFGYIARSPGFEINDLGYMRDSDVHIAALWGGYNQFAPGKVLREWHFNSNIWDAWNYGNENVAVGGNINLNLQFMNYWGIYSGVSREMGHQNNSILRGGPTLMVPGSISSWHGFYTDRRKKVSFGYHGSYSLNDEGFKNIGFTPSITIRPSGIFELSLSPSYRTSENDIQYVDEIDGHYIIANIKMQQLSITTRLNLMLTPEMSLQFYGMPFIAAGDYSNFREVVSPRAKEYSDRFAPYDYSDNLDFNFKQFRSNLVFRWEFSPGSTIYLVWSRGATDYEDEYGRFSAGRDFERLLDTKGDNTFMIKINKWFSL